MGHALAREAPARVQRVLSRLNGTQLEIALAGLDGSGKSSLAAALERAPPPQSVPTIGLVVRVVRHSGIRLSLWDLGGRQRYRTEWARHAAGCDALFFVIDVVDRERLPEARQALHQLLDDARMRGIPLLVVASKYELVPPAERAELELSLIHI